MYPTTSLQFGMSGPEVTKLQQFLVSQGMSIPSGPTGYFGNETKAALTAWQQKTGVQAGADFGYWGPKSIAVAQTVGTQSSPVQSQQQYQSVVPTQTQVQSNLPSSPQSTNSVPPPPPPPPTSSTPTSSTRTPSTPTQTPTSGNSSFPTTSLTPGTTSDDVRKLQEYLVQHGYMTAEEMATGPGTYGPKTILAVTKLQKDIGVDNSSGPGYFGPQTIAVLSGQNVQSLMDMKDSSGAPITNESATSNPISTPAPGTTNPDGTPAVNQNGSPITTGTPYHMGDYSLVRFDNGMSPYGYVNNQQLWLLDSKTRTLRPFENAEAISNFFEGPVDINSVPTIAPSSLNPGGTLGEMNGQHGYQILSSDYKINADGTAKKLDYTNADLAVRYGQPIDSEAEKRATLLVSGFADLLASNPGSLNQNTLNSLKDPSVLAFYMNAVAYGGYTAPDLYRDLRKRELGLTDVTPISATATRQQNKITPEGLAAASDSQLTPPPQIGNVSIESLNLAISDLPDEAFKTLIPILDIKSDQFKSQMGTIQDAYNDVLMQQINAQTEQEKVVADYAWEKLRKDIETSYGIQLSSNAREAGAQIEQAFTNFSNRGIQGSGMQNQAVDQYLANVRRSDQISRLEKLSKTEAEAANYYSKFGTSKQIADIIAEDKAKGIPDAESRAVRWGLVPSAEIKSSFDINALKAKYPNVPVEDLQRYASSIIDENGNYRSGLFQKQVTSLQTAQKAKEAEQQTQLLNKSLNLYDEKSKEFTTPDSPFLRTSTGTTGGTTGIPATNTNQMVNLKNEIGSANLGYNLPGATQSPTQSIPQTPLGSKITDSIKSQVQSPIAPKTPAPVEKTTYTPLSSYNSFSSAATPAPAVKTPSTMTYNPLATTKTSTPAVISPGTTTGGSALSNFFDGAWKAIKSSGIIGWPFTS